jgi:hypothetical protein
MGVVAASDMEGVKRSRGAGNGQGVGRAKIVLELVLLLVLDQVAWQARKAVRQRSGRIEDESE